MSSPGPDQPTSAGHQQAAPRFFTAQALATGESVELEEGPSRHAAGALRLKPGSPLVLFDGNGGEYTAVIERLERKRVVVRVGAFNPINRESELPVTLGLSVSRGDRMDLAIQKSTELGVAGVVPLLTERTEVKLQGERRDKKHRHWQHIALSACEQCGRNIPPEIAPLQPLAEWLAGVAADCRLVLHHRSETSLAGLARPANVALLVGPEGGLSEAEIAAAEGAGFQSIRLGPRVLRTETAPLAALSVIQFHWGDLQ